MATILQLHRGGRDREFETIAAALARVRFDLETDQGKRIYLAYLTACRGAGDADAWRDARINDLQQDIDRLVPRRVP